MALPLENDPINELEENLECTVCLEPLKDPRTLPCFHSFCKDCLEDVVKTCRDKAPRDRPVREFPCPNCREMFTLDPDKNVADMRRNHFICNMVKATAVLNRDRKFGVPCSHNCTQSYSVARCVTCEKFLCQECLTAHNSYRGHTGHSVLTMEELSKPENRKKIKDKMYCNEHPGEILKVYCETCDQLICKDCMDFEHMKPDHSCSLINKVVNKYKELLDSSNKKMDDVLTENNLFLKTLEDTSEGLARDVEFCKSKITQRKEFIAKKIGEMLDQKVESLLNEVDEIYNHEQAKLDKQTTGVKQYAENVQRSVHLSKKLVEEGTEEEILSSQKMMLDSANNLLTKRNEHREAPVTCVENFYYTYCTREEEPLTENITGKLVESLGEVIKNPGADGGTTTTACSEKNEDTRRQRIVEKFCHPLSNNVMVCVHQGDITKETVDAIVNPTNEQMNQRCMGVPGALLSVGGTEIQQECNDIRKKRKNKNLNTGDVVVTTAGNLPCKFIVHVMSPRWNRHSTSQKETAKKAFFKAVLSSLINACQKGATSIAMPSLSSGRFGFPADVCAEIMFSAAIEFAEKAKGTNCLKDIRFVDILSQRSHVFVQEMKRRFGEISAQRERVEES
ncbi:E3 ubiquitin-protein ligase TRIM36-like [Dendronephthya gigantea]|uniref:E3 ubiquitin-protein ligase TRIM36-like n=1 Tax=Dendronephthya gigantea TaxID=151771 RepID=UPI00106D1F0D|nr:E3 ubiquitin-protein ligase TRIM36-like [Dendronephthya gigantea]